MKKNVLQSLVAFSLLTASVAASAGTIGSLSWDGTSNFITSTEDTTVAYLQFGLLQGLTFAQAEAYLDANFPLFELANFTQTNHFANQLFSSSNPFPTDANSVALGVDYIDNTLGATRSANQDVFWNPWGNGTFNTLTFDVVNNTVSYRSVNTFDLTGTNNIVTGNGDSWLAVGPSSAITTAVPEPETYAMFMAGLGLLGFASRRKKA